jgi:hypothetical protein
MQSKITKNEALGMIADSIGSIFTKDDVLELINRIDVGGTNVDWIDMQNFISEYICDNVDTDCVDRDTAEFDLDGNTIELSRVEFDSYSVESVVRDAFAAYKK